MRKTPTWQLSSLPSRPLCCRATPAECRPCLAKQLSSRTPTTPIGEPAAEGASSSAKASWISSWRSSACQGAELMNFWSPETSPWPTSRAIGSDALALGAGHEALDVVVGMVLRLLLAEARGEAVMEADELVGRGAHIVRR